MCKILKFIIGAFSLIACQTGNDYSAQLKKLDNLLDQETEYVLDSLQKIDISRLNEKEKAYYYLLQVCATDKKLIYHAQDSMLQIAKQYYQGTEDYYNLARVQYYLAKYTVKQGKQEAAYDLFKQAEMTISQDRNKYVHLEGLIYYQLARLQYQRVNFQNSIEYCNKSFDKFIEVKNTISSIHSLKLLGQIYINNKKYNEAHIVLAQALDLINSQKNQKEKKICEAKASILNVLSIVYRKTSDIPNALKYGKECINLLSRSDFKIPPEYYYNVLAVFTKLNMIDSTKHYCNKIISETANKEGQLISLMNGYKLLAQLEEKQGNYKEACSLKDTFNTYKDKYNTENKSASFIELEKKYDIAQKERQVVEAKNIKLRSYGAIVLITILTLFTLGLLFYKHRKLTIMYNQISEIVRHSEWGLSITKELILENNLAYEELQRILNRCKIRNTDSEVYKKFEEAFKRQKLNYSAKLFSTLTDFDKIFIKKMQKKYPNLNPEDIIISAMLRHNWSQNDIAAVFHVSSEAIRKRKARLKQKFLDKTSKDEELDEFLKNI